MKRFLLPERVRKSNEPVGWYFIAPPSPKASLQMISCCRDQRIEARCYNLSSGSKQTVCCGSWHEKNAPWSICFFKDHGVLCFLWFPDGDLTKDPTTNQMLLHIFGGTSSPSIFGCTFKTFRVFWEVQRQAVEIKKQLSRVNSERRSSVNKIHVQRSRSPQRLPSRRSCTNPQGFEFQVCQFTFGPCPKYSLERDPARNPKRDPVFDLNNTGPSWLSLSLAPTW